MVTHPARQIDVVPGEKPGVKIIVDCLLIQHNLIDIVRADMETRLHMLGHWGNDIFDSPKFSRQYSDSSAAFAACGVIIIGAAFASYR